jgi:hypothetical protein
MKTLITSLLLSVISLSVANADSYVNGYYRKNGTYVQPHWRSSPDSNAYNNWTTQGNVNPYTGQLGTRNPYSGNTYQNPYHTNQYGIYGRR